MRMSKISANSGMPRLAQVTPAGGTSVEVTWSAGPRMGRKDNIDLAPLLFSKKIFRPLRDNPILFSTVHVISRGNAIAWAGSSDLEMSARSIEQLAKETFTAEQLQQFLRDQGLTHEAFAGLISYSRRQVENFLSGSQPVPRVVALACIGLAQRGVRSQLPPRVQPDNNSAKIIDTWTLKSVQRIHSSERHGLRVTAVYLAAPEIEDRWMPSAASMNSQFGSSPSQVPSARALKAATTIRPENFVPHFKVT